MAKILMLYANDLFYEDLQTKAIAGTQTAFIELSKAFHKLGNDVTVLTRTIQTINLQNYRWLHLDIENSDNDYDLMIVNVSPALLGQFSHVKARKKVLWIHNTAQYLLYWNRLKYLLYYRPVIVFSGNYHLSTLPFIIPTGGRKVISYGLTDQLFNDDVQEKEKALPKVFFTSNPLRSLRWLVDIWVEKIHPQLPLAELHIFSGWETYGKWGESVKVRMKAELDYAAGFANAKVVIRNVIPKKELFDEMKQGRAMFYRGDQAETFCLAIAEAQALGLPAVVCDFGSMKERIVHGETGFVARNDNDFVKYALKVMTDDLLWQQLNRNAKINATSLRWENAARAFIKLV
jgi:glycosyltransferase involved in cell wall biosynthesis